MMRPTGTKKKSPTKSQEKEQIVQVETVIVNESDQLNEAKQWILNHFLNETAKIWKAHQDH